MSKGDGGQWLAFPQTLYSSFISDSTNHQFDVTYFGTPPGDWWIYPLAPEDATGENFGISFGPAGNNGALYLPVDYVSGEYMEGCIIHRQSTFETLNPAGYVIDGQTITATWTDASGTSQLAVFRTQRNAFANGVVPEPCFPLTTMTTTTTTTTTRLRATTTTKDDSESDGSLDSESD